MSAKLPAQLAKTWNQQHVFSYINRNQTFVVNQYWLGYVSGFVETVVSIADEILCANSTQHENSTAHKTKLRPTSNRTYVPTNVLM